MKKFVCRAPYNDHDSAFIDDAFIEATVEAEDVNEAIDRFEAVFDVFGTTAVKQIKPPAGPHREPVVRMGEFAGSPEAAEAVVIDDRTDYEILILDQGFEPEYNGWNVRFQAIGAPRFSYSQVDPILDAYVKLEAAPSTAPRLGSGSGGSALARTDTSLGDVMLGGGQEGAVLRGALGAAMVEVSRPTNTPRALPSDDAIAAACQRALSVHITAVKAERARLDVTEGGESVVGKKLKVKG